MKGQSGRSLAGLKPHVPWVILLALIALAPMAGELISTTRVLSDRNTDVTLHFLFSRAFGFGEMARGNLPLWNPYIYSGIPYLGQFQSALLYPLNLIFLILPLATAINWSFGLHVFLLGSGMYLWGAVRGLKPSAASIGGVAGMFNGAFLLHIYAGHLSNVCTIAWIPFILLAIERWVSRRHAGWLLLAAFAAAMQIFAGHPQYFYYTALVAGLYAAILLPGAKRWIQAAAGLAAIYPMAAVLAAAQLLPGLTATQEAVRGGGVAYEFSAMFSFPPENILTVVMPWIFGDMQKVPYWGRCYLWEMSLYSGIGMVLLAIFGAGRKWEGAGRERILLVAGAALVLALGSHTPLHKLLYEFLPGFGSFRGSSKFIVFVGLIIALFAGIGADRLLRRERFPRWIGVAAAVIGAGLFLGASLISEETVRPLARSIMATRESYLNPAAFDQAAFLQAARTTAGDSLRFAGVLLVLFAGLFVAAARWKPAAVLACVGAVAELAFFARSTITTFPLADFTYHPVKEHLEKTSGDYRILNLFNADASMMMQVENIWGYDPGVLKRYAQLLHLSQGNDPESANQYLAFHTPHPILGLFRCRFAFVPKPDGKIEIANLPDPFPRFLLYAKFRVVPDPKEALASLRSPWFDLSREILLESPPVPAPDEQPAHGEIKVLDRSTDHWTLEVTTDRAAILAVTDSYSKDWHVTALPGSVQPSYTLLPANYAMRAIPLSAGHHLLRMEYTPAGFRAGVVLSLMGFVILAVVSIASPLRRRLDLAGS